MQKRSAPQLVERITQLISSVQFRHYAEQAGIVGVEKELLLAYLVNLVEVIKPAESLAQSRALLDAARGHTF